MVIKQVKKVADIPSEELDDWGPVPEPISDTVSQLRGRIINEHPDGSEAGISECTPGTWEVLETVRKAYLTFKRDEQSRLDK